MRFYETHRVILKAGLSCIVLSSCVEPFEPVTETFESALVIEAVIADEMKQQRIYLSRIFALEEDGPKAERNARVRVIADNDMEYLFQESAPGVYVSSLPLEALTS
jgi:hypothetical protein